MGNRESRQSEKKRSTAKLTPQDESESVVSFQTNALKRSWNSFMSWFNLKRKKRHPSVSPVDGDTSVNTHTAKDIPLETDEDNGGHGDTELDFLVNNAAYGGIETVSQGTSCTLAQVENDQLKRRRRFRNCEIISEKLSGDQNPTTKLPPDVHGGNACNHKRLRLCEDNYCRSIETIYEDWGRKSVSPRGTLTEPKELPSRLVNKWFEVPKRKRHHNSW